MTPSEIAIKYLECLRMGDLAGFPVAESIVFQDPLTNGPLAGKQRFLDFVAPLAPAFVDLKIHRIFEQGQYVIVQWDAHLLMGTIPVMELFRIEGGLVVESIAYFDPRPITNPVALPATA